MRFGLLLTALLCAAGALASAAPAADAEDEGAAGAFRLKGTHGYSVSVIALAEPNKGGKGEALILVARRGSAVIYDAPATVTAPTTVTPEMPAGLATSIQADLHGLGRISLTFKATGGTKTYRSPCDKQTTTLPAGNYEGTFELHGEEGYTEASATQTPFDLSPLFELACSAGASRTGRGASGASLILTSKKRHLSVQVGKNSSRGRTEVGASLSERYEGISIGRAVSGSTSSAAFSFDSKLRTASLRLPSPFSGHLTFSRAAGPSKWLRGNLKLDFPGKSNVPLTGKDVRASLSHVQLSTMSLRRGGEIGLLGAFVTPWVTNAPRTAIWP